VKRLRQATRSRFRWCRVSTGRWTLLLRPPSATPPTLREHVRQPLESFGGLLKTRGNLVRVSPVGGIQAIGECVECRLPRRIRRSVRNALTNDRVPVRQKRDALVRSRTINRRRDRDARWRRTGRCGRRCRNRHRRRRRNGSWRLILTARPSASRLGRRLDQLLALTDHRPIERDIRILRFNLAKHIGLERIATDAHTAWRSEHVQDLRSLTRTLSIEVHQIRGLVATFVANHPQEWHRALLVLLAFHRLRGAGGLS